MSDATDGSTLHVQPHRKYLALIVVQIQQTLAYRSAAMLDVLSSLLGVAVVYYLWKTVFAAQPRIGSFDWSKMQAYVLLAYAIGALLDATTLLPLMQSIRTGEIATELVRPYNIMAAQLAQACGRAVTQGLLSGGATLLLGVLIAHMAAPVSLLHGCCFALSIVLAFAIMFLLNFLLACLCFWTKDAQGLLWARSVIISIFSGSVIPLQFFPSQLQSFAFALPFQALTHTPLAVYLGDLQGWMLMKALAIQIEWLVMLWLLAIFVWPRSLAAAELTGG